VLTASGAHLFGDLVAPTLRETLAEDLQECLLFVFAEPLGSFQNLTEPQDFGHLVHLPWDTSRGWPA